MRWRTSARGNKYLMATLSDTSGQIPVSCFDEPVARDLEDVSRGDGCAVLTLELDRRAGEDAPRAAVKRVQPFESLASSAAMVLDVAVDDPAALPVLAGIVGDQRGGRGEICLRAAFGPEGEAKLVLGRNFRLDGELAQRVENLQGIRWAALKTAESHRPAAVQ